MVCPAVSQAARGGATGGTCARLPSGSKGPTVVPTYKLFPPEPDGTVWCRTWVCGFDLDLS